MRLEELKQVRWADMEKEENCESLESSEPSSSSCSLSEDLEDDASTSPSSSPSRGPLYELADIMAHLPIKRGLSKYYEGKSQSYGSLASVEDLAKCGKRMKSCKSYGSNLNRGPKPTIAKRT